MTPAADRRITAARRWPAWTVLLGLLLAGCGESGLPQSALDPAGPVARAQDNLWDVVLFIAVVVFVIVQAAIVYIIFRYRDRGGDDIPKQVAGNTRLELIWTLIPAVILVGIAVPTVRTIFDLSSDPGDEALDVRVIGKQYWWGFEYLGDEGQGVITANELHVPAGRPVFLTMQSLSATVPDPGLAENPALGMPVSNGVIHSFWVPRLAGKQDVVPGHTRQMTIEADEPGVYPGQCAEFCGLSHARMRFVVVAHEPDDFQQWLDDQAQPAVSPDDQLAQRGEELFETTTCVACHAIDGYEQNGGQPAQVRIGPNLTHFASRELFAGGVLENNEQNVKAWLANPQALKAGAQMPNLGLQPDEIDALTAYLETLE